LRIVEGYVFYPSTVTSRAKTFGGIVIHPDAILASSSASSLYRRGMWLSSMT
jgi:hypothetical protein